MLLAVFPHLITPLFHALWVRTPSSKVEEGALVGGSIVVMLCQWEWTSLLNWLHVGVMLGSWIHIRDLQLGIV